MPHSIELINGSILTPFGIRDLLEAVRDYAGDELAQEIESYRQCAPGRTQEEPIEKETPVHRCLAGRGGEAGCGKVKLKNSL